MRGELLDAIIGLLRQLHIGVAIRDGGFAGGDDFLARADFDSRQIGCGDGLGGLGLLQFGEQLRIVDLDQKLSLRDVVAARHRSLADPSIDARGDVDARRVGFALNQQRLRQRDIPERKPRDGRDGCDDDEGRRFGRLLRRCGGGLRICIVRL
jgi:hypothetical protein